MKTLYLVRHAKSSWSFNLPDHDRPLGKRGRKDVLKMGQFLYKNHKEPNEFISSTASRAFYTALHICDAYGLHESLIKLEKKLFHASPENILEVIKKSRNADCLALFGHNPGITHAANMLIGTDIENIPTCGVVGISFEISSWQKAEFGKGKLEFFHIPKKL